MKKHAIIPIFIPHFGCPNTCVFCNQHTITARTKPIGKYDVEKIIKNHLPTLKGRSLDTIEIAFFGGSFTGIPFSMQADYLSVAYDYKQRGIIDKIRLSTRPDYISAKILNNLRSYDVDLIELGVQSFDSEVLKASKRGHTAEETYNACDMIKRHDFELGIQLMAGLPGDTKEKAIRSAECAANIGPSTARIYPTVVLEGTELCKMLRNGDYKALSEKDAIEITKEMYKILHAAGINIIRVGLKSTDHITNYSDLGGGYHPAFRQLVEGAIALEKMESQLARLTPSNTGVPNTANYTLPYAGRCITFVSNSKSFPAMIGHKACNKNKIAGKYKCFDISYKEDNSLPDYTYELREKL